MGTLQLRRGPAATWTSDNPTLSLGEPGVETDNAGTDTPLAYKIGDGATPWRSLPYFVGSGSGLGSVTDGTNTVSDPTELLFSGATVSNPSSGIAEVRITASSGGSGIPPAITPLGNQTGTATLPSPNNGDLLSLTMTGDLTLTLPAAPPSGETLEFDVIAYQGPSAPTDGYTLTLVSSVGYPSGTPVLIATAGSANWIHCKWSPSSPTDTFGTEWSAFPVTSGPTVVACLALRVIAGNSNMGGTGGRWMGVCAGEPTQTSPQGGDWWIDDSTPTIWVWNGSSWVSLTGSSSSGVVVSSPLSFQLANYDAATSSWVGTTPKYYDITQPPFSVQTSGDNTYKINNAMFQLAGTGITPWLPPNATPYPCTTQGYMGIVGGVVQPVPSGTSGAWAPGGVILFSNGVPNSTVVSGTTFTNGQDATYISQLEGGFPTVGNGKTGKPINAPILETVIQWAGGTGYSGSLVMVLGPTSSGGAKNIRFDGNSSYAKGPLISMLVLAARAMKWPGVSISNCINGLQCNTVQCTSATATNCVDNDFDDLSIQYTGQSSPPAPNGSSASYSYGVLLGYDGHVGANSCYNHFTGRLNIVGPGTTPTNYGFVFQGCDSNTVENADISSSACTVPVVMDYSASNGGNWPAGNTVTVVETGGVNSASGGGVAVKNIGTPSGSYANAVLRVAQVNGYAPNPNLQNLIWDTPGIKGTAQLVAGQATLSGFSPEFANAFGGSGNGSIRAWIITPGGTLGAYYESSYASSVLTLSSMTSGGSVNTSETSLLGWELVP